MLMLRIAKNQEERYQTRFLFNRALQINTKPPLILKAVYVRPGVNAGQSGTWQHPVLLLTGSGSPLCTSATLVRARVRVVVQVNFNVDLL